ncbi:MAG: arsenate reductase family protein [Polyangiales bacterium]
MAPPVYRDRCHIRNSKHLRVLSKARPNFLRPAEFTLCHRMLVYQYPRCSTCRKAVRFLEAEGVDHKAKDIVESPPSKAALKKAIQLSGLPINRFFNTSGQSYRQGGFKEKLKTMSHDQALSALAADGKLIKRPLVLGDGFVLVGFREADWRDTLGL